MGMLNGLRSRGFAKHNHPIDRLAEANGLLTGIALYPQLFKVIGTREVASLSPSTFFIIFVTNIIWLAYAFHRKSSPIVIAGVLNVISSGALIVLFFLYGD